MHKNLSTQYIFKVSAITWPDRTDAKVYYQSSPGHEGDAALRRPMSTPPIKNETGTNPGLKYWAEYRKVAY